MSSIQSYLDKLAAAGVAVPAGRLRVDGYGDSPELSAALIELVRSGRKRGRASLLWAMEHDGDEMPMAGDIEIVVDHVGEPVLLARVVSVAHLPFEGVSAEFAAIEGEGDGSLAYWRQGHWEFFARECERIGRRPTGEMPVVCCVFDVIAVLP